MWNMVGLEDGLFRNFPWTKITQNLMITKFPNTISPEDFSIRYFSFHMYTCQYHFFLFTCHYSHIFISSGIMSVFFFWLQSLTVNGPVCIVDENSSTIHTRPLSLFEEDLLYIPDRGSSRLCYPWFIYVRENDGWN